MSSSGIGLNAALAMGAKSLSNQRIGIEVTGRNIANVNTKGASRQRTNIESDISIHYTYGQEGTGAYVASIQGLRSQLLDASVVREDSLNDYYSQLEDQSTLAQSALGEKLSSSASTATSGTASSTGTLLALNQFFDSWQALSTSPTDESYRQQVLSKAQTLAMDLNTASQRLVNQRDDVATDAASVTTSINTLSDAIANLNAQIVRSEAAGGTANDLRDQRQLALENLGKLVDITVDSGSYTNGMIVVSLASSSTPTVTLVDGTKSGDTATTASLATDYDSTTNPPLTITYTTGSVTTTLPTAQAQAMTGQLGADLVTANEIIGSESNATGGGAGMLGDLDTLAANIVSIINTQHALGYDENGTAGGVFFTAANTRAVNISVSANISSDLDHIAASGTPNKLDGTNANAMANLRSNANIIPAYQGLVADIGQQVQQYTQQSASQQIVTDAVTTQRDSVSGISLDEETTNLQMYQRAYEASARFISVIDAMLSRVINGMGAGN